MIGSPHVCGHRFGTTGCPNGLTVVMAADRTVIDCSGRTCDPYDDE